MKKSYILGFLLFLTSLVILLTYYSSLQNKIPDTINKANETIFNVDKIRFTFKISTISKRALNSYLQAIYFKDQESLEEALEFYEAVIGFAYINYTKDQEVIDFIVPKIESAISLIEEKQLRITKKDLNKLIQIYDEINYFVENREKNIWAEVKKSYVNFMTYQESEKNIYKVIILLVLIFSIAILILLIQTKYLKKQNKNLAHKLEYAADNALAGYWEWNLDTNYLHLSKGWSSFLGYDQNELKNNFDTFQNLLHPDDVENIMNHSNKYIQNEIDSYSVNFRLLHKNGTYKWVSSVGKILDHDKRIFFGFHIDIDDLTTTKEMLIAQSKTAMLGEMIGLIAHQFKQPLNIISLISSTQKVSLDFGEEISNEQIAKDADTISNQIEYLGETIDTFRDFLKPNKEKEDTFIPKVIDKSLLISKKSLKVNSIEVIKNYHSHNIININSSEFMQVIINLINNSKDAFKINDIKNRQITINTFEKAKNAIIEIEDNAGGIKEEILPNIFNAYYTTKEKSKGTGLGLYIIKTIIEENYKGSISVENSNEGVKFTITLPLDIK